MTTFREQLIAIRDRQHVVDWFALTCLVALVAMLVGVAAYISP